MCQVKKVTNIVCKRKMAANVEPIAQQQSVVNQTQANSNVTSPTVSAQPQANQNQNPQEQQTSTEDMVPVKCIRNGCTNPPITNPEWEDEYCSNDCVVTHCRNVFMSWVASNSQNSNPGALTNAT